MASFRASSRISRTGCVHKRLIHFPTQSFLSPSSSLSSTSAFSSLSSPHNAFSSVNVPATFSVEGSSIISVPVASSAPETPPLSTPLNLDPPTLVEREPLPDEGWLKRFLKKHLKGNMLHAGETLAKTVFKHCENPAFQQKLGIPNDHGSILALKALHVWILQQRIHEDVSPQAEAIILRMYDVLWMDLENVLNRAGYLVLSKHKEQAQSMVYGGLVTYDRTLQVAAEQHDYAPYLGALWRCIYASDRNLNKNHLVQLREYVVEQRMRIRGIPENDFYQGLASFGEPGPLLESKEAAELDPDVALKPFFQPGSEELKYNFPRSPLRNAKFVANTLH